MAKRITMSVLQSKCPDRIREIEMKVDAAVFKQEVAMQFWQDVRLYGLHEACMYLQGYADDGLADKAKVADVHILRDTVIKEASERLFSYNPLPEGNGFDHIDTATPNDD